MNKQCQSRKYKFSANVDIFLKEEFIEMTFDLETKSRKWILLDKQKKNVSKYQKFYATTIILVFLSSYIVESGFSCISKKKSTLNIECDDLQLKLATWYL